MVYRYIQGWSKNNDFDWPKLDRRKTFFEKKFRFGIVLSKSYSVAMHHTDNINYFRRYFRSMILHEKKSPTFHGHF